MSSFNPPLYNSDVFNPALFDYSTDIITIADADKRYFKLSGGIVNGFSSFINGLSVIGTLSVNGTPIDTTGMGYITGITPGIATASKALVVDSSKNITSIGNVGMNALTCTGAAINGTMSNTAGFLDCSSSFRVTSGSTPTYGNGIGMRFVGLSATGYISSHNHVLSTHNNIDIQDSLIYISSTTSTPSDAIGFNTNTPKAKWDYNQASSTSNRLRLSYTVNSVYSELYCDASSNLVLGNHYGTLLTAAQPNITSLGTLTGLTIASSIRPLIMQKSDLTSGNTISFTLGKSAAIDQQGEYTFTYSSSTGQSTLSLGHYGTPQMFQVYSSGLINISGTTDASSSTTGILTVGGGVGVAKNLYVGSGIYGTIQTAAQPNITSIGTLASLTATNITGTLQTAAQPNITSVGTLTGLAITKSANDALVITNPSSSSLCNIKFVGDGSTYELGTRGSTSIGGPTNGFYIWSSSFRLVINSTGQVGIATATPTSGYILDVNGNLRCGGTTLLVGATTCNASITANTSIVSSSSTLSTVSDSSLLSEYSMQCRLSNDTGGVQQGIGFLVSTGAASATTPHAAIRVRRAGAGFWGSTVYIAAKPSSGSTQTSNIENILTIPGDGNITHDCRAATFGLTQTSTASPAFVYQTTTQNNATALLCQTSGNSVAVSVAGDGAHIGAGGSSSASLFLECNAVSYWKIDSTNGYFMSSYQPQNARIGIQCLLGEQPLAPLTIGHSTINDKLVALFWAPTANVAGSEDFYGLGTADAQTKVQGKNSSMWSNSTGTSAGDRCLLAHTVSGKAGCVSLGTTSGAMDLNILKGGGSTIRIGEAESAHNCFSITYNKVGSGNTQNYISFDEYGTSKQFIISAGWGCGIGDTPSNFKALLHLNGSVSYTVNYKTYNITTNSYSTVSGSSVDLSLYCSQNAYFAGGGIYTASDARLKTNIMEYDIDTNEYMTLRPKRYLKSDGNGNKKWEIGLVAQEVVETIPNSPDIVKPVPMKGMRKTCEEEPDDDWGLSLMYDRLPILNICMIQKLTRRIELLEAELDYRRHSI
jgi:hypothetical protein